MIPVRAININFLISVRSMCKFFDANGNKIRAAKKNLKKARVKGPISCNAHLKIGGAAPQIIFVTISARTARRKLSLNKNCTIIVLNIVGEVSRVYG